MSETTLYKCYTSEIDNNTYYWYITDFSTKVYGNEKSLQLPLKDLTYKDRVANIILISITDKVIHLIFDKDVQIYGLRNNKFDIEG